MLSQRLGNTLMWAHRNNIQAGMARDVPHSGLDLSPLLPAPREAPFSWHSPCLLKTDFTYLHPIIPRRHESHSSPLNVPRNESESEMDKTCRSIVLLLQWTQAVIASTPAIFIKHGVECEQLIPSPSTSFYQSWNPKVLKVKKCFYCQETNTSM